MDLRITKDTEDLREGRTKILKAGTELTVTKELGKKYLKKKLAEEIKPLAKPIVLETADEAERYNENENEEIGNGDSRDTKEQ